MDLCYWVCRVYLLLISLARDSDARDFGRPEQFLDGSTTLTGNLSEAVERFER